MAFIKSDSPTNRRTNQGDIMPYIEDIKIRKLYDGFLESIKIVLERIPKKKTHGHLNYIITRLILNL